jgi:lipoprotein-releasing system permease protein
VGDQVYLINPVGNGTGPMGVPVPRVQPFRVAGVFYSGMYEYDTKWTYVSMKDGQAFLQSGDVATGVEIRVDDPDAVEEISRDLEARLPFPWFVKHWQELNRSLFSALKLEKYVMGLILFLIVMVASLNIVGSLILVVVTRAREIAILRALGASSATVRWIFLLEGLIIGVVGTTFGTALGLAGCDALRRYRFPLDTDVYYLDTLPVVVDPANVVVVAIVAVLICFGATLYPASVAAGVQPVDGLRYE